MARIRCSSFALLATILVTLCWFGVSPVSSRRQRYLTGYACEGSQLSISCEQPDQHIQLVRSNFGRFSISICNAQGQLDWSVNCHSPNSARLIADSCNGHRHCLLQATTEFFGDPCAGTQKYLEVHYQCVSNQNGASSASSSSIGSSSSSSSVGAASSSNGDSSSSSGSSQHSSPDSSSSSVNSVNAASSGSVNVVTAPPPPPIIIPTLNPLVKPQAQPAVTSQRSSVDQSSGALFDLSARDANRDIFVSHPYPRESDHRSTFDLASNADDSSSSSSASFRSSTSHCPALFARGLAWNRTTVGQVVTQPCPPGSSGLAQWFCSPPTSTSGQSSGQWAPSQPIFAQCQSGWLAQVKRRVSAGESALLLSAELATSLAEVSQMHGGDVRGVAELLRLLLQPLETLMANNRLHQQKGLTEEMLAVSLSSSFISCLFWCNKGHVIRL
jgi:hypothetical protein